MAQLEYSPAPTDVDDFRVTTSVAVTINGNPYYAAWSPHIIGRGIARTDDPNYGAWSATAKGGTRQTVIEGGEPGADEVSIDFTTMEVVTDTQDKDVYLWFPGHGRVYQPWEHAAVWTLPGYTDPSGGDTDIFDDWEFGKGGTFVSGQVHLRQGPTGAALTYRVQKSSGEGSESEDLTIADGDQSSEQVDFSNLLVYQPGEHLRITLLQQAGLDANNFPSDLTLHLNIG
ncbi:MAG: hypothetical protein ACYTEQ_01365 [Planctomycetota bacterium]|jgi:hypothetical protein